MDWIEDAFSFLQQWLFETLMQPAMFGLGQGHLLEDGYAATGWLLVGLIQIAVLVAVIGPLQRLRPVEIPWLVGDPSSAESMGWRRRRRVDDALRELIDSLRSVRPFVLDSQSSSTP